MVVPGRKDRPVLCVCFKAPMCLYVYAALLSQAKRRLASCRYHSSRNHYNARLASSVTDSFIPPTATTAPPSVGAANASGAAATPVPFLKAPDSLQKPRREMDFGEILASSFSLTSILIARGGWQPRGLSTFAGHPPRGPQCGNRYFLAILALD